MAYFDDQSIVDSPGAEEERRRQMLAQMVGRRGNVLGLATGQPPPALTTNQPGSRDYDLSVSATNQPAPPTPRTIPAEAPTISPSFTAGPLGGGAVKPARPDVMPQRTDFPAKPELGGWKKVLGLGAGFALGSAPIVNQVLHGQENAANRRYQGAVQDWEREQGDTLRSAQIRNINSEIEARRNPKPEKPENIQQTYADAVADAQARGVDPAKDQKVLQLQDAITSLQKQPAAPKENKAVAGTVKGQPAWGVQTDKGWIDPQTQASIPDFKPAPNYAQVAPGLKTIDILSPDTGLPTIQTLGGKVLGTSATGAYGHEAAQAGAVTRAGAGLIQELNANRAKLGNMQAIIESAILGTPWADPKTANLRAQIASFAALQPSMHGFRGTDALKEFEKLLGGIPNNPDAMIAAIQGIQKTAGAINPALAAPQQSQGGFKPF